MQDLSEVEKEWIKLGIEKNYEKDSIFCFVLYLNSDEKLREVINYVKMNPNIKEEELIEKFII